MQPEDLFKNSTRLKLSENSWERIKKDVTAGRKKKLLPFYTPITSLAAVLIIGVVIAGWWLNSKSPVSAANTEEAAAEEIIDPDILAWYSELGDYSDLEYSELDDWMDMLESDAAESSE